MYISMDPLHNIIKQLKILDTFLLFWNRKFKFILHDTFFVLKIFAACWQWWKITLYDITDFNWAMSGENLFVPYANNKGRRSAWASAQSVQRLCCSLPG